MEPTSDGICDAVRIFGLDIKNKILGRVHGTPWNHFVLDLYVITYLSVAIFGLVFFFLGVEHTVELVQLLFDLTKEISH